MALEKRHVEASIIVSDSIASLREAFERITQSLENRRPWSPNKTEHNPVLEYRLLVL